MRAVARQPCDRSIIANEKVLEVVMSDDHNVKKQQYQFSQMNRTSTSPPARDRWPVAIRATVAEIPFSFVKISRDDDAQSLS